jgi:hypothetical protein
MPPRRRPDHTLHAQLGVARLLPPLGHVRPLDDVTGRVQELDPSVAAMRNQAGHERVPGRVGFGEDRVGGERAPRPADEAEAAYLLRREQQQDLE